jgi:hypothetical protein
MRTVSTVRFLGLGYGGLGIIGAVPIGGLPPTTEPPCAPYDRPSSLARQSGTVLRPNSVAGIVVYAWNCTPKQRTR